MSKRYTIVFSLEERDQRLLKASLEALASEALAARFSHTVEYDDSTEKYTLTWWHKVKEEGQ